MKKVLFLLLLLPVFGWAQKTHTVGPKESLYSIGRQYNVHPRELAAYNNLTIESSLTIGQVLKIPAKKTMAPLPPLAANDKPVTEEKKPAKETNKPVAETKPIAPAKTTATQAATLVPVYHVVQKKENLYQISRLYNKVPIDNIKKWNNLSSDALSEGMKLIVGYSAPDDNAAAKTNNDASEKVVTKTEPKEEKKAAPVEEKKADPVVEKKADPVIEKPVEVKNTNPVTETKTPEVVHKPVNFKGGSFKSVYEARAKGADLKEEDGMAGVFKSNSGWNDGRFYCLHNTAEAGTIIKITNKATGKSVYAKVLDIIPDLKQNNGLLIRISNAAADELGAGENNFECILNYSK